MMHPGSLDTYNSIADWIAPDFFFSKKDGWDRFGMLGVFGDYVLSCTQGDILEIGVGESSIYLTALARKYNRRIYLCDASPSKIDNPLTVPGYLDPNRTVFFPKESDKMFEQIKDARIALAFIDGDHRYEQVKKDFDNLWPLLVENGYVFIHDTYPPGSDWLDENHCGTVYKLRQELEEIKNLDTITLPRGTSMGVGLTICRKKPSKLEYFQR